MACCLLFTVFYVFQTLILPLNFQGDVIVSFDDVRVGSEGTVPFRSNERIAFRYLISQK